MNVLEQHRCFGGTLGYYDHEAATTGCAMRFTVFVPAGEGPRPVLWWLSGLTCTEDNFTVKAGAYQAAAEAGLMVVATDTSPRGDDVPDDDAYDLGQGAGFYLDATESPWAANFQMYSYITRELPKLVLNEFPANAELQGIAGHSMGGHGALTIGLQNPQIFKSLSAFAPICTTLHSPWGKKALGYYLGSDTSTWMQHDSCEVARNVSDPSIYSKILIDQGADDPFLAEQLRPELLKVACEESGLPLELRIHDGYDHGYYFISTFIEDHLRFHATQLGT